MPLDPSDPLHVGQSKPEDTITFKRSHFYMLLVPLAFVAGLALGFLFWGRSASTANLPANVAQVTSAPTATKQAPVRYHVPVGNSPSLGPENAPITLIEFSDYECPYCQKWYQETFPQIMQNYQGKVRFVYRDFPLTGLHSNASPAAEAAYCAGEQGNYWAFHDKLFSGGLALGTGTYDQYATDIGLNLDQFNECISTNKYQSTVEANYQFAANLGIQSTPTFFINGLAIVGAQPYSVFKQVIDQELAGEIP
jgi:protein-disulfide isomerase